MKNLFGFILTVLQFGASTSVGAFEQVIYYHNDVFGSPVAATDSSGAVLWKESYAPYGDRTRNQDQGSNEIWFHAKPVDVESGLSYFGARYYDPTVGRFMGIDPAGFDEANAQSFNRYAYGNNNPYRYRDPDGRAVETILDVISLSLSIEAFKQEPSILNGLGLAYDAVAAAVPVLPAGVGIVRHAGKAADAASDAVKAVSGETKYTSAGRRAHNEEPLPPGFEREIGIPGSKSRMDGYNRETREIIEIKPGNPRATKRGERQLERYCAECDKGIGPGHTARPVQTYDPKKYIE